MTKRIALLGCLALLIGATACKKEQKKETPAADPTAGKTTEPAEPTPPEPPKVKLDTPEDKVTFYKACYASLNAKDWEKFGACYADSVVSDHVDMGMPAANGRAAVVDNLKKFATAFPDFEVTPTLILVSGNKIASTAVFTGTHQGALVSPAGDVPATNKKLGVTEFHMVEVDPAAGGVVKEWVVSDMGTVLGQLGLHKSPVRPVATKPAGEAPVVIAKDDDAEKANVELYKKGLEMFSKKDMKGMGAMWDDKAVMHDYGSAKDVDKKKSEKMTAEILKAFPDAKGEIIDIWAAGEYVVAMVKNSGTNKGAMPSMGLKKPTNKAMAFTGADVIKFQNGKAVESWSFYNGMAIAQQLGLIPPPGAGDKAAPPAGDKGAEPAKGGDKPEKGADKAPAKGEEKPAEGANP